MPLSRSTRRAIIHYVNKSVVCHHWIRREAGSSQGKAGRQACVVGHSAVRSTKGFLPIAIAVLVAVDVARAQTANTRRRTGRQLRLIVLRLGLHLCSIG